MLLNTDVSTMLRKVRVATAQSRKDDSHGVLVVEPEGQDPLGIAAVRASSELLVDVPSGSARPVAGPLIVFAKRAFRRLVRWYSKPVAIQQTNLNNRLLDIDEKLGQRQTDLNKQIESLFVQFDDLRREVRHLSGRPAGAAANEGTHGAGLDLEVQRILSYSAFEDRHRGSQGVVRPILAPYLTYFDDCTNVVDLGCGRGEFVAMLRERGINAYGVDSDESQVKVAQAAGRDVRLEDAVAHLNGLRAGEIDGAFSSQVAEHLTVNELIGGIELVHRKLAPGGVFVMETPNPEALFIFATFFYVDLTHIKPIHPEALRWAFEACGFEDVQVVRSQPVPDSARLSKIPDVLLETPGWDVIARNFDQLNSLIYGYQHYAVVARKALEVK